MEHVLMTVWLALILCSLAMAAVLKGAGMKVIGHSVNKMIFSN